MERAKAERTMKRRLFSLCLQKLKSYLENKDKSIIHAEFDKLSNIYDDLRVVQNKILNFWLDDEGRDQASFDDDIAKTDEYDTQWYTMKQKVKEFLNVVVGSHNSSSTKGTIKNLDDCDDNSSLMKQRRFRLPKLQLAKFDGAVKSWITFWAQFRKIDSDDNIDNDDKFQYLLQSMEQGSIARELVESYPPSGDNYVKVLEQLKQRFAKDEILIEHYVRELLYLVLAQAKGTSKTSTRSLFDKLMTQILALETLGVTQDKYAAFLLPLVESALPDDILKAWNRSHFYVEKEGSPLDRLLSFIKHEVETDERIRLARSSFSTEIRLDPAVPTTSCLTTADKRSDQIKGKAMQYSAEKTEKQKCCLWCDKSSHVSSECIVAIKKTLDERKEFVKRKNACFICLNIGHTWNKCKKHPKCVVCGKRHYPIMCSNLQKSALQKEEAKLDEKEVIMNETTPVAKTVLLQTLMVNIISDNGVHAVRALLDSGAQRSFIKSDLAEKLQLKVIGQQEISHVLFGGSSTKKEMHKLYELFISNLNNNFQCKVHALDQKNICGHLPSLKNDSIISQLQNKGIFLNDCDSRESEISLLIGSDFSGIIHTGRSVQFDNNLLAIETKLGWTLQGPVVGMFCTSNLASVLYCEFNTEDFWKLETLGIKDQAEVKGQKVIESEVANFFKDTITVNEEERYEVRLLWKDSAKLLKPNYELVLKRLRSTTARVTHLKILQEYNDVFNEWLDANIIEEVENDDTNRGHYMAHHAVLKQSSLTTKIRPVFDASALDINGFSLNSCLEKGINLIELIPKLLIRFRKYAIGVTADIKKAFLQISLHTEDRDYLKFLWWRDINESDKVVKTFRHRRVVFGVTTSPFLLSATILHHLDKYDADTANKLKNCFYVDNCITSLKDVNEMDRFITEAKDIMMDGKFELRCWVTGPVITDENVTNTPVLGLVWNIRSDQLHCKVPTIGNVGKITKRSILSLAQSVFDPLGFVSPTTIIPKIVLQKCWILNVGWDDEIPDELMKPMKEWINQITILDKICIPRRLSNADLDESNNTLHIFSDTSSKAYACCIFLRSEYKGDVSIQLVLAKSRVAPSKVVTIPRLELIAALMASRLASEAKEGLELKCREIYWTDSSIVLAWINRKEGLNVFVYNRVKEILQQTNVSDWYHIPGHLNPADLPSRGCNPEDLLRSRWWDGPAWLRQPEVEWPHSQESPNYEEYRKEVKEKVLAVQDSGVFSNKFTYFSKFSKIVRLVGWCSRFIYNCRHREGKLKGDLSANEYQDAEILLLKIIQNDEAIEDKVKIENYRDNHGLVRIKTRLLLCRNSESFVTPILLPGKNVIVERLVTQRHIQDLHSGSQALINSIREHYWVLGIRKLAKKVVHQCVTCKRYAAKPCQVHSSPLPLNRIECGYVFEVTGIDLAGPLLLRSGEKCWVVLFTCATYRAVHFELCTSLSTENFMLSLRRFIARRGRVKVIYSDNGTNLRGASNIFNKINWQEIASRTSIQKIQWRFIPPAAPWWGGFWERMVRMLKETLRRCLGRAALHYQEMVTVLCEVEAVINARPLTYIAETTENVRPLTPLMFMRYDNPGHTFPEADFMKGDLLTSRWKYMKNLIANLKSRFRSEYLSLLTQKSGKNVGSLRAGDMVLIGSDESKRVEWPLGLILEMYPGVDGHCRVARLKTCTGERIRPLQRLYPLEVTNDDPVIFSNVKRPSSVTNPTLSEFDIPKTVKVSRAGRLVKIPHRLDL